MHSRFAAAKVTTFIVPDFSVVWDFDCRRTCITPLLLSASMHRSPGPYCNRLQSVATDREVWCGNGIKLKEGDTHHEITPTGEDNYLGVVIDGKLDFEKHINIKASSISHRKILCITEWCKLHTLV